MTRREQIYREASGSAEQLGHQEGLATAFANLGLVYKRREDVDMAAEYYRRAQDCFAQIGATDRVAQVESARAELYGEE